MWDGDEPMQALSKSSQCSLCMNCLFSPRILLLLWFLLWVSFPVAVTGTRVSRKSVGLMVAGCITVGGCQQPRPSPSPVLWAADPGGAAAVGEHCGPAGTTGQESWLVLSPDGLSHDCRSSHQCLGRPSDSFGTEPLNSWSFASTSQLLQGQASACLGCHPVCQEVSRQL